MPCNIFPNSCTFLGVSIEGNIQSCPMRNGNFKLGEFCTYGSCIQGDYAINIVLLMLF